MRLLKAHFSGADLNRIPVCCSGETRQATWSLIVAAVSAANTINNNTKGKTMKKLALLGASLLLMLSSAVFAEEHADAALTHAKEAVEHGKAGHAPVLVEHAEASLAHAKKAVEVAKGENKTHLEAGVKALEEAIKHGKMGHADVATKSAEEAVTHIQAGDK
jgi:hypothetical protein